MATYKIKKVGKRFVVFEILSSGRWRIRKNVATKKEAVDWTQI